MTKNAAALAAGDGVLTGHPARVEVPSAMCMPRSAGALPGIVVVRRRIGAAGPALAAP